MKQVFNGSEVAHIWASQQQKSGRNSGGNFYFDNQTIYSYGSHFPIATIRGNDVFFTLRSYSNTTAKHIGRARGAISHKNIIWVNDVPVNFKYLDSTHENNLKYWKREIQQMVNELGNKRNKAETRLSVIARNVAQLNTYCDYFKLKIKDKDLKSLLSLVNAPDFVDKAREAKAKQDELNAKKLKQAAKAYEQYITLWRKYDKDGIENLSPKVKELCNFYNNNSEAFTRLRFNADHNRLETSKGVQIPAEIAKRAYKQLNGCIEGTCNELSVPVMNYTITKTTKDAIIAGCHTIPKEDVRYIAQLLNW